MSSAPSVILLGSKPGSVAALTVLLERGWQVRGVVVCSEHHAGWMGSPSLEKFARSRDLPVFPRQKELPSGAQADFVISYMYRHRVRPETLGRAGRAALNFHAAPLPEFGGWAYYSVAILEGAREYGVTCHHMDEGFDTGPILKVRRFPVDPRTETAVSLERRSQREMILLFREFCELAESGAELPRLRQDPARVRYMRREEFEALKEVPPGADPEAVERRARAFWYPPYECAYIRLGDAKAEVVPALAKAELAERLHAGDLEDLLATARRPVEKPLRGDHR